MTVTFLYVFEPIFKASKRTGAAFSVITETSTNRNGHGRQFTAC